MIAPSKTAFPTYEAKRVSHKKNMVCMLASLATKHAQAKVHIYNFQNNKTLSYYSLVIFVFVVL
tara:strand:+ start:101 stop:292 length:192 start_codon:yes stop_codon:yes gene_type:complete